MTFRMTLDFRQSLVLKVIHTPVLGVDLTSKYDVIVVLSCKCRDLESAHVPKGELMSKKTAGSKRGYNRYQRKLTYQV